MKIVIRNISSHTPDYRIVAEFDLKQVSVEKYTDFSQSLNSILTIQAAPLCQPSNNFNATHTITHDLVLTDKQLAALQKLMRDYAARTEKMYKSLFRPTTNWEDKMPAIMTPISHTNQLYADWDKA